MSVEAIKKIRDCIANEENAYSIQDVDWRNITKYPEDSHQGECGTPACILGWASHIDTKNEIEYKIEDFYDKYDINSDDIYAPIVNDTNGKVHYYCYNPEWFTRKRTIAMLDNLIENKVVDWLSLEKKES